MKIHINKTALNASSDVLELLSCARSEGCNKILIRSSDLIDDFFDLRSGVAGDFLQKFINYSFDVAIVFNNKHLENNPRFREMIGESNSLGGISYFLNEEQAIKWLGGLYGI